jgi:tetratricopeptide (TPR) repeat protein
LQRLLRGDLDLVVLKALQKEPERRYASAEQFCEDIDQFLKGRPVRAHRDHRFYHVSKLIQRHPVATAFVVLGLVALVIGLIGQRVSLVRACQEAIRSKTELRGAEATVDDLFTRIFEEHQFDVPGLQPVRAMLLERALLHYEDVLSQHGNDSMRDPHAAEAQTRIAQVTRLIGPPAEAVWQFEKAIEREQALVEQHPEMPQYRDDLVRTLIDLGEVLMSLEGKQEEALGLFKRAGQLIEPNNSTQSLSASRRRALIKLLGDVAEIERGAGQLGQAQASLQRALELATTPGPVKKPTPDDQVALASIHIALGRLLGVREGMFDQAVMAYTKGIELRQTMIREHPDRVDQIDQLARNLGELALLYQAAGHLEPADRAGRRASELFTELDRRFPDHVPYETSLYLACDMMSHLCNQRGESAAALEFAGQARGVLERLVTQQPSEPVFRNDLSRCHDFIGRLLRHKRAYPDAFRSFQRAADVLESQRELDPPGSYQLAISLAACVSLIGSGPDVDPPDDESKLSSADRVRRQIYGKRAVTALDRAIAGGFANLQVCQTDSDLDPLRDRADFQKLVKDLSDKDKAKP